MRDPIDEVIRDATRFRLHLKVMDLVHNETQCSSFTEALAWHSHAMTSALGGAPGRVDELFRAISGGSGAPHAFVTALEDVGSER